MLFIWSVADRFMLSSLGGKVASTTNTAIGGYVGLPYNSKLYEQQVQHNDFLPRSFQPPLNPMAIAADVVDRAKLPVAGESAFTSIGTPLPAFAASMPELGAEFYLTRVR